MPGFSPTRIVSRQRATRILYLLGSTDTGPHTVSRLITETRQPKEVGLPRRVQNTAIRRSQPRRTCLLMRVLGPIAHSGLRVGVPPDRHENDTLVFGMDDIPFLKHVSHDLPRGANVVG